MNIRQTVVKNTVLQLCLHVFNLLAGFYSMSLIARYLGKIAFGKYGFVSSFYFFFFAFLDFGISAVVLREVSKERERAGLFLSNILTFKFMISVIFALIAVTTANIFAFPQDLRFAILFYSPILIFIALESIQIIFEANLRYEYIVLASFSWRISSLLFVILAVRFNLGLTSILVSFVLAEVIKYINLYIFSKKFIKIKFPSINIKLWIDTFKSAVPIGITYILITIIRNTDVMVLSKMRGFAEVGLYTAPHRLCDMSLNLPLVLIGSIFPLMSKFYKQDFTALKRIYQKTFDVLSICGILLVVLVLALADKIIILLFGADYIRSAISFRILIFSVLFVYLAIGSSTLLVAMDRQKANMRFYLLAAPLNIILNLILIPRSGFIGAAISNTVATFLVISLTFYFVSRKVKIPLETIKIKKAIIAGLITLVVLFYFKDLNLFISLVIGILLYAFLIILTQAIEIDEIMLLAKREIQ